MYAMSRTETVRAWERFISSAPTELFIFLPSPKKRVIIGTARINRATGNIGINKSTPNATLDVNGSVRSENLVSRTGKIGSSGSVRVLSDILVNGQKVYKTIYFENGLIHTVQ